MIEYFDELKNIRNQARENHIPIIRDRSLEELIKILKLMKPKRILELGTAIGYSSILISKNLCYEKEIITIEKDIDRYKEAIKNFKEHNIFDVKAVNTSIDEYLNSLDNDERFDFIFLDGPKSHYLEHIRKIEPFLIKGSTIYSDDILYFGKVEKEGFVEKKHRTIVVNLRKFLDYMFNSDKYDNCLIREANGILISKFKG